MPPALTLALRLSANRLRRDERGLLTVETTVLIVCILVVALLAWRLMGDVVHNIIGVEE